MRTVTYKSVVDRIAGYMQDFDGLSVEDAGLANIKINFFVRLAWEHYWWPELMEVERRRMRPVYNATENIVAGEQRFFIPTGTYFQALQTQTPATQPPATGSNATYATNTAYWAECMGAYSGSEWVTGHDFVLGETTHNPDDDEFYQCIEPHTSGATFDGTKFGVLIPFIRSLGLDGTRAQSFSTANTKRARGVVAIANGVEGGTVSGLALGFTPTLARVDVMGPSGSLSLLANPISTSLSADGFSYELNGITDSADYVLVYELAVSASTGIMERDRVSLGNAVSSGTVTGLDLGFVPTAVFLEVMRPAGGLNLKAWPVIGSLSSNGFSYELNGETDSTGYVLVYEILWTPGAEAGPRGICGTIALANGAEVGAVTGLDLEFTPTAGQFQVMKPADGLNITARGVVEDLTADGSSVELSGVTDSGDYVLLYRLSEPGGDGVLVSDAPAETDIGEIRFIWDRDPRIQRYACRVGGGRGPDYRLRGGEAHVLGTVNQLWVEFRRRPNIYTGPILNQTHAAPGQYIAGTEVYDTVTGDYWTANQPIESGQTPTTHPEKWDKVEFPYIFAEFVAQSVYAMLTDREQEEGPENFQIQMSAGFPLLVAEMDKIERQSGQARQIRVVGP